MAKKTTKSNTRVKTTKKKTSTRKKQAQKEENSFGITLLIIGGLILLIYFASNIEANVEQLLNAQKAVAQMGADAQRGAVQALQSQYNYS